MWKNTRLPAVTTLPIPNQFLIRIRLDNVKKNT